LKTMIYLDCAVIPHTDAQKIPIAYLVSYSLLESQQEMNGWRN